MGFILEFPHSYFINVFYNNLEEECKSNNNIKDIIKVLKSFFMSEDFLYYYSLNEELSKNDGYKDYLEWIFLCCEQFQKCLFPTIFFPLIEELKNSNFESHFMKINELKKINEEKDFLSSIFMS